MHVLGMPPAFVLSQDQTLRLGVIPSRPTEAVPDRSSTRTVNQRSDPRFEPTLVPDEDEGRSVRYRSRVTKPSNRSHGQMTLCLLDAFPVNDPKVSLRNPAPPPAHPFSYSRVPQCPKSRNSKPGKPGSRSGRPPAPFQEPCRPPRIEILCLNQRTLQRFSYRKCTA